MNKTLTFPTPVISTYANHFNHPLFTVPSVPHKEHQTSIDNLNRPFTVYERSLKETSPQSVDFLWQERLPNVGITLLDGDHACGKSLLALDIAASISAGHYMPDGTPAQPGGVVIVTPDTDATTTQLQMLTAMKANLSRIEILSYVEAPTSSPDSSSSRPFSLPEDFSRLWRSVERVNARLVILDPFISLLSRNHRWTEMRLCHLLADLNQRLIERRIACLLIRNCPARGGHARPSMLERSDAFIQKSVSRLLLAPDPMEPDCLLLSHAHSRHAPLNPTLILRTEPYPGETRLPHLHFRGTHRLSAQDFIDNRPDTLHRRLLFQHLQGIINASPDPIHVSTLYTQSPHSSVSQIQRTLNDLLRMGQIERPARGFYSKADAHPIFSAKAASSSRSRPEPESDAEIEQRAREAVEEVKARYKDHPPSPVFPSNTPELDPFALHYFRLLQEEIDAGTLWATPTKDQSTTSATTPPPESANDLNSTGETTPPPPEPANNLNTTRKTKRSRKPTKDLNTTGETTPPPAPPKPPPTTGGITTKTLRWTCS